MRKLIRGILHARQTMRIWSRRLDGYGVGFPQGGRRMAVFAGRARVKIGGFRAPTPPRRDVFELLADSEREGNREGRFNERETERADSTRGKQRETRTGGTWN